MTDDPTDLSQLSDADLQVLTATQPDLSKLSDKGLAVLTAQRPPRPKQNPTTAPSAWDTVRALTGVAGREALALPGQLQSLSRQQLSQLPASYDPVPNGGGLLRSNIQPTSAQTYIDAGNASAAIGSLPELLTAIRSMAHPYPGSGVQNAAAATGGALKRVAQNFRPWNPFRIPIDAWEGAQSALERPPVTGPEPPAPPKMPTNTNALVLRAHGVNVPGLENVTPEQAARAIEQLRPPKPTKPTPAAPIATPSNMPGAGASGPTLGTAGTTGFPTPSVPPAPAPSAANWSGGTPPGSPVSGTTGLRGFDVVEPTGTRTPAKTPAPKVAEMLSKPTMDTGRFNAVMQQLNKLKLGDAKAGIGPKSLSEIKDIVNNSGLAENERSYVLANLPDSWSKGGK